MAVEQGYAEGSTTTSRARPLGVQLLEYAGAAAGIIGAMLIASNTAVSAYGWIAFAISSALLTAYSVHVRAWGLLALQLCFCLTNAIGLWRWLIQPALT